ALVRKQLPADLKQLLTPLLARHPGAGRTGYRGLGGWGHHAIMPNPGVSALVGSRATPGFHSFPARPTHVIGPAELLEGPDGAGAAVELAGVDAVAGAGRVGVVQVVPGLAHRQHRQPPDVGRLVTALERTLADGVADRVDRPRDVVEQADADQRPPEEGRRGPLP